MAATDCTFMSVLKANLYHDATGAFTSKDKAVGPRAAEALSAKHAVHTTPFKVLNEVLGTGPGRQEFLDAEAEGKRAFKAGETTKKANTKPGTGSYSPQRLQLHQQILDKLFEGVEAVPEEGQKPMMIMLGGRPGSGKSSSLEGDSKIEGFDRRKYVVLDTDRIKELIPEYVPQKSALVHQESSDIFVKAVISARNQGLNVVLDFTMSNETALTWARSFMKAGYQTEAHYIHRPLQLAAESTIRRWQEPVAITKLDGTVQRFPRGRLVPLAITLSQTDNEKHFDKVSRIVDGWTLSDNSERTFHVTRVASGGTKRGYDYVLKSNPYHDETGAFTSKAKAHTGPVDVSGWKKVGPQAGSNPGGVYEDSHGTRHYVKFPQRDPEQANAEKLADDIYRELGIPVKESQIVTKDGRNGLAGKMVEGAKELGKEGCNKSQDVKAGYVVDAYLGNWDVFGMTYDNVMRVDGRDYRIDNGGTMFHRAQGEKKNFPADRVDEIDSLIGAGKKGALAFGDLTPERIKAQATNLVTKLTPERLTELVAGANLTGDRAATYLKSLIGRREFIARKYGIALKHEFGSVLKMNPYKDEKGRFTSKEKAVSNSRDTEKWEKKDHQQGRMLNGVVLQPVENPDFSQSVNRSVEEPPLNVPKGMPVSAGVIMVEPDGRVWLVQPQGMFGGYKNTFAKGTVKEGEDLQETAAREVWEETGLVAQIDSHLIDVQRTTSVVRFYVGRRVGGAPWSAGKESYAVKLMDVNGEKIEKDLRNVFGQHTSDYKVLQALRSTRKYEALSAVLKSNPYRDAKGLYTSKEHAVSAGYYKTKSGKHLGVDAEGKIHYGGKTVGLMASADLLAAGPFASLEDAHAATGKEGLHLNPEKYTGEWPATAPKQVFVTPKTAVVYDAIEGGALKQKVFNPVTGEQMTITHPPEPYEKPPVPPYAKEKYVETQPFKPIIKPHVVTPHPQPPSAKYPKGTYIDSVTGETIDVLTGKVIVSATPKLEVAVTPAVVEKLKAANFEDYVGKLELEAAHSNAEVGAKTLVGANSKVVKKVVDVDVKTGNNIVTYDHEFYSNAKAQIAVATIRDVYKTQGYTIVDDPKNPGEMSVSLNTFRVQVKSIHAPKAVEKPKEEPKAEVVPEKVLSAGQKAAKAKYNEKQLAKYTAIYEEKYMQAVPTILSLKLSGKYSAAKAKQVSLDNAEKDLVKYGITSLAHVELKEALKKKLETVALAAQEEYVLASIAYKKATNSVASSTEINTAHANFIQVKSKTEALLLVLPEGKTGAADLVNSLMASERMVALKAVAKQDSQTARIEALKWGATEEQLNAVSTDSMTRDRFLAEPPVFKTKGEALNHVGKAAIAYLIETEISTWNMNAQEHAAQEHKIVVERLAYDLAREVYKKAGGTVSELETLHKDATSAAYDQASKISAEKQLAKTNAVAAIVQATHQYYAMVHVKGEQGAEVAKEEMEKALLDAKIHVTNEYDIDAAKETGRLKFEETIAEMKNKAHADVAKAIYAYEYAKATLGDNHENTTAKDAESFNVLTQNKKYVSSEDYKKMESEQREAVKVHIEQQKKLESLGVTASQVIKNYDAEDATFKFPSSENPVEQGKFKNVQAKSIANLSEYQKKILIGYTQEAFRKINKAVGQAGAGDYTRLDSDVTSREKIREIDAAMSKVTLGQNVRLTRTMPSKYLLEGLKLKKPPKDQAEADDLVGRVYTEHAFSSTSMRPGWGSAYSNASSSGAVKLNIRAGKDIRGIRVVNFTSNKSEDEVVLARGTVYVIRSVKLEKIYGGNDRWVFEVDAIAQIPVPLKNPKKST